MEKQASTNYLEQSITGSQTAAGLLREELHNLDHEESWVLLLNNAHRPLAKMMITVGSIASTIIDHRRIVKEALMNNATAVILFHNHPSGDPTPSSADIKETEKLRNACAFFDISLLDHIIIADRCFFSFADESKNTYRK